MNTFKDLFIFELANNHQGSVEHGINIIREMAKIAKEYNINAGIKLQYRDLDTFIHPDHLNDNSNKHISRFLSTKLSTDQFKQLVDAIKETGLRAICTPFDERSVDLIQEHGIEIIKVASCSADDWPLLERISKAEKPIISSTGGLELFQIDNLVSFYRNRNNNFAILHCVGIYPTPNKQLHLNFIKKLINRYEGITIGYSGHEDPDNTDVVKIATALGSQIFERHVGLPTDTVKLNAYSINPDQVRKWIEGFLTAREICGNENKEVSKDEVDSLNSLKRGVFAKANISSDKQINSDEVFFAMPLQDGQITSGEFGKFRAVIKSSKKYTKNSPITETAEDDKYLKLRKILHSAKGILSESKINIGNVKEIELSHHYGLDKFNEFGCLIINLVNREYCKKIIVVFPGQRHPEQKHLKKEETFHVLFGNLTLSMNGIEHELKTGDIITIERGDLHEFWSEKGAIFEEVSTTHYRNDSFYTDPVIATKDPMERKTIIDEL